ncbi:hypothetical protein K4K96_11140 [Phaeobacter inhibens]|uniref:hypothetical protein n=1 Tax=Phaeobacter inhibens TaxID=221822 RepID=UPI0021A6E503|nr:hypothetical protein [Phaeobacter inhibens]UWR91265.1 hypothetical protein K4K96_11140 [Phaeobacter inhibens]
MSIIKNFLANSSARALFLVLPGSGQTKAVKELTRIQLLCFRAALSLNVLAVFPTSEARLPVIKVRKALESTQIGTIFGHTSTTLVAAGQIAATRSVFSLTDSASSSGAWTSLNDNPSGYFHQAYMMFKPVAEAWPAIASPFRTEQPGQSEVEWAAPLWADSEIPGEFEEAFRSFEEVASHALSPWSFWHLWLLGRLTGVEVDPLLQKRIAQIEDFAWDAGPEAVAIEIDRIQAEWLAEQLPQSDQVSFDSATGLFFTQQVPLDAVTLVETTLKQVEFARSVAAKSNCGFNSNSTAWMYIEFTLESCRGDANAIEQNLEIALQDIIGGLKDSTYQPDGKLTALEQVLDRAVTDLRAHHPDVAEAWEARVKHKLKLAKSSQKQLIIERATELISVSHDQLGTELELDAKTISTTAGEVQSSAIRRFFGRVAQMRIVIRSSEVVKRIDASSGYKGTRIVQTLQSLIDLIVGAWSG